MRSAGQVGIEVLLVVAFVIVMALAILLPYVESQNQTNAAIRVKLTILPFVEMNDKSVKVVRVQPVVSGSDLVVHVETKGTWDGLVRDDLLLNPINGCFRICTQAKNGSPYSTVVLDWNHNGVSFCSRVC